MGAGAGVRFLGLLAVLAVGAGMLHSTTLRSADVPNPARSERALAVLTDPAADEPASRQAWACRELGRIPPAGPAADRREAGALAAALDHDDPQVRAAAARALGRRVGRDASAARTRLPELIRAAEDPEARVRSAVAVALGSHVRSGAAGALPALIGRLEDPAAGVRHAAWTALERGTGLALGLRAEDALETPGRCAAVWRSWWRLHQGLTPEDWWRAALVDGDTRDRAAACRLLGRFGAGHRAAWLAGALADDASGVRAAAGRALRETTGLDLGFEPLADPEERARQVEAWTAWADRHGADEPVAWLAAALGDERTRVRGSACGSLGRLGAADADVRGRCRELLTSVAADDPASGVRERAEFALRRLQEADDADAAAEAARTAEPELIPVRTPGS